MSEDAKSGDKNKGSKDERDMPTKIRDWPNGQGFPLEMRTAKALRSAKYTVQQSQYFRNTGGVQQEIDIIATKAKFWDDPKPGGYVSMKVVAECKANPKVELPWVVFTAETHHAEREEVEHYLLLNDVAASASRLATAHEAVTRPELLTFGERLGFGIQCAQIYSGKENEDLAYNAVLKLTHAALSQLQPDSDGANIVVPVLVVRTPLYECWLDDAGTMQLAVRTHLAVAWHRSTEVESTRAYMLVHVVHESGLVDFVEKADAVFHYVADTCRDEVRSALAIRAAREHSVPEREKRREITRTPGGRMIVTEFDE
jgi:hypothetical protein